MSEQLEEPAYELLRKYRGFEVRKYVDTIQARVSTKGMNYGESARPFRRIAGYIFGGNERQQSIAMTAPVHMWQSGEESLMAFTMPSEHNMKDLPKPNDSGRTAPCRRRSGCRSEVLWSLSPKQVTEATE